MLLAACSSAPEDELNAPPAPAEAPEPASVTYHHDPRPECTGTPEAWDAAASAFALWQDFGIRMVESDATGVAVCLRDGEYWGWRSGSVAGNQMDLRTDIDQPSSHRVLWAIAAHEMGHVVLQTSEHSGDQGEGLTRLRVCPTCEGFTASDIAWVESFGLVHEYAH